MGNERSIWPFAAGAWVVALLMSLIGGNVPAAMADAVVILLIARLYELERRA